MFSRDRTQIRDTELKIRIFPPPKNLFDNGIFGLRASLGSGLTPGQFIDGDSYTEGKTATLERNGTLARACSVSRRRDGATVRLLSLLCGSLLVENILCCPPSEPKQDC